MEKLSKTRTFGNRFSVFEYFSSIEIIQLWFETKD